MWFIVPVCYVVVNCSFCLLFLWFSICCFCHSVCALGWILELISSSAGRLTLGENIADLGGIKQAFTAYSALRGTAGDWRLFREFTNDQLFFIGYAQSWCSLTRPSAERVRLATDPHSPPMYRVNGPLSDFAPFAEAFNCPVGSAMRPAQPCAVW